MVDMDALRERMDKLERRISAARERLALHSTLHMDHAATLDELSERYQHLQQQLNSESTSLEHEGMHIDSFEKTVLEWVNGLTFPH